MHLFELKSSRSIQFPYNFKRQHSEVTENFSDRCKFEENFTYFMYYTQIGMLNLISTTIWLTVTTIVH